MTVMVIISLSCADDESGRQDFVRAEKTVTFPPSEFLMEQTISIPFNDDDINEASEGYFIVMTISESNVEDDVEFLSGQNVTIIRINDDDGKHALSDSCDNNF